MNQGMEAPFRHLGIAALVGVAFGVVSAAHGAVLYYDESDDHSGAAAIAGLGLTATTVTSDADFLEQLTAGGWQVVLVERSRNSLVNIAGAIRDYISGGGRVILSYWGMSESTAEAATARSAFGIASAFDQPSPSTVYRWAPADPIFTTPNVLGNIPAGTSRWVDNGDRLQAGAGASAIAGFTSAYDAYRGAIVVANGGRTIANGFLFDAMDTATVTQLIQNEIMTIPEPATVMLLVTGGVMALSRRRRD